MGAVRSRVCLTDRPFRFPFGISWLRDLYIMQPMFFLLGRLLVGIGLTIAIIGAIMMLMHYLPLGQLPGDWRLERPGFRIHVPIATMLVVSVVLTVVVNVVLLLLRRLG